MAHVADHLSIEELGERYRSCSSVLGAALPDDLAAGAGHTIAAVAELTCFLPRWIEELLARYNALGPPSLGDLRRHNGSAPSVLKPELLH